MREQLASILKLTTHVLDRPGRLIGRVLSMLDPSHLRLRLRSGLDNVEV